MFLSKTTTGIYYIYYNNLETGKRNKISCKTKLKSNALKFLSNFQNELRERNQKKINGIKLSEFQKLFLDKFQNHSDKRKLTLKYLFDKLLKFWGDVNIKFLKSKQIESFLDSEYKTLKNSSFQLMQSDLKFIIQFAKDGEYIPMDLKITWIKLKKKLEHLPLYFSQEDFLKLYNSIQTKGLKEIVLAGYLTGMRENELTSLTWHAVNIEEKKITLQCTETFKTKNRRIRVVPLNVEVVELLKELYLKKCDDYVFHYTTKCNRILKWSNINLIQLFTREIKRIFGNDSKYHFHCLRHSFASNLAQKGIPIFTISKLLGHSQLQTTMIYSHLSNSDLQDTINSIHFLN